MPTVYDIIIGDFGREAATRYVAVLAEEERLLLTRLLAVRGLAFLDEYRRIMFSHVADVAYLKKATIEHLWLTEGHLTDDVLVAVKEHDVPPGMVARFADIIYEEALAAARRGHGRVRVTLPCNALSETLAAATQIATDRLGRDNAVSAPLRSGRRLTGGETHPRLSTHGVVQSTIAQLSRTGMLTKYPFAVLGAAMANEQYSRLGKRQGMTVISLTSMQQSVVDEAVLACIGGSEANVVGAREEIQRAILVPLRRQHPTLVTLEACTDFDLGIGLDSVRLMAQHLVQECYAPLTW